MEADSRGLSPHSEPKPAEQHLQKPIFLIGFHGLKRLTMMKMKIESSRKLPFNVRLILDIDPRGFQRFFGIVKDLLLHQGHGFVNFIVGVILLEVGDVVNFPIAETFAMDICQFSEQLVDFFPPFFFLSFGQRSSSEWLKSPALRTYLI